MICRGIERRPIFRDEGDREAFVLRLGSVLTATGTICYAWALLPNHVHLLLRTGNAPLPTVMRRLLTGYAGDFNRRHRRHGYVFQNRYKSILCEEEPYFLELVRYIHLNPLRVRAVDSLAALGRYPYAGHSRLVGTHTSPWQDTAGVLARFGAKHRTARRRYEAFVAEEIARGRRPDLTGGGLARSAGGWRVLAEHRRSDERVKGDERILGAGAFVEGILRAAEAQRTRRDRLRARGVDLAWLLRWVATHVGLPPAEIQTPGKHPIRVRARSLLCFLAVREVGLPGTLVAQALGIGQPAVSRAVTRGERYAREHKLSLQEEGIT